MRKYLHLLCDELLPDGQIMAEARSLVKAYDERLLAVFDLIVENGKERSESIKSLEQRGISHWFAEQIYYRSRIRLLRIFGVKIRRRKDY